MTVPRGRDRKVIVEIAIEKLVPVISNDGGYLGRQCLICNAIGWGGESDVGYRHRTPEYNSEGKPMNGMRHNKMCLLNQYIDINTGRVIPK